MNLLKSLLMLLALFFVSGCGGKAGPEADEPAPPEAEDMSEDELEAERALGAPPKE